MISLTIQRVSSAEMRTTFLFITERTATIGLSYHGGPGKTNAAILNAHGGRLGRRGARDAAPRPARGLLPGGREARSAARPVDLLHDRGGRPAGLRRVRALRLDRLPEPPWHGRAGGAARTHVARVRRMAGARRHGADHEQAARRARLRVQDFGLGQAALRGARARALAARPAKVAKADLRKG